MQPRIPGFRLLHSPGPTHVPDAVVAAMSRQPTDLADPRVATLVERCEAGMKTLLGCGRAELFFYSANGHGGWEAVIANLVAPGSTILVPGTGHFSDSWAEQVEAFGGTALRTPYREGFPIDPAVVEAALRDDREHRIGAVFAVHTDTASGTTSDLQALRRAIDAAGHPALFVVDVVASLGAAPFAMDALGVDAVMGASQKGLMLQPGMAFVAAGARALAAARGNPTPRYYWDWERRVSEHSYRKFCGTPPLAHLAGLAAALELIEDEGLDQVHARHARLARAVHAAVGRWAEAGAVRLFTRDAAARSVSVTAVETSPGVDPEALRAVARERFQVAIAGGLGPLSGRVFRIGHLGDMNEAMVLGCLAGVEAAMRVQGVAHGPHGVDAAIDSLARSTAG
ncbi:MAG TPA: aminotransferase class V-fold PLP-dependent enzyme [Caldimonas sp.]|nr:aminotransferase class V-fold PLP-dependent enzyme [Caldimonas sp.]